MVKKRKAKEARREKGPLETPLEPRPPLSGLLYDSRPEWDLKVLKKVVAFAEQAGIDPKAKDFGLRLAWYLLRKHEPAFQPEPRGRHAIDPSIARAARRELINLFVAENASEIAKGRKPLSDKGFADKFLAHTGRPKLPPYYRTKPRIKESLLRQELRLARGALALCPDEQIEIMKRYGLDEAGLARAAKFRASHRARGNKMRR